MDKNQTLELTVTPEVLAALKQESGFTSTPIEVVINTILESVLFAKAGKPRITGPQSIGGQPLQKVTGPSNWK